MGVLFRLEALFLDPGHMRNDVDDTSAPADSLRAAKGPIQTDAIDCLLQIALFAPGRELLESCPAVGRVRHNQRDDM